VKADHEGGSDQIFYGEFDGRRRKRALVKIIRMIAGNRGGVFGQTPALVSLISSDPFPSSRTQGNVHAAERVAVEDDFRSVPPTR
jgi:hypothetical protein